MSPPIGGPGSQATPGPTTSLHGPDRGRGGRVVLRLPDCHREPYLDRDVIELTLSVPPEYKMTGPGIEEKKLLRDAFFGWLPEEILRHGKLQFGHGAGAKDVPSGVLPAEGRCRHCDG
ncbi:asparagine synthase C-terminal domain-containing protein [Streptomyces anulatus]|uniref:asparagine synthase C-terminal domain-containing protein n=1 Tax=Streptomyces anulatus TaxID=1892 RepID=UPI0036DDBCF9